MTPNPRNYRSLSAYRLAQADHALARDFARKLRRLVLASLATVVFIVELINWPGITLACLLVGLSLAALVGGLWLWQAGSVSREYDEEHDSGCQLGKRSGGT